MDSSRLWITWEIQRRNRSLSSALHADLHELISARSGLRRYLDLVRRTIRLLRQERPQIVFAQNPSIVLAVTAVMMSWLMGYRLIIDAHNAGLLPAEGRYPLLNAIAGFINRRAEQVIVTNETLRELLEEAGGRAFVLPDPIPQLPETGNSEAVGPHSFDILLVCSWSSDEPWQEVLKAAASLPEGIVIHITGNFRKVITDEQIVPQNVRLTGFLSEEEYVAMLKDCDAIMVLTHREDCLVCGGYEAVAAGKPLLLSDTQALRDHFDAGCVYTVNDAGSIADAVADLQTHADSLREQIAELKQRLIVDMQQRITALEQEVLSQRRG